jgi:hypothetical protein
MVGADLSGANVWHTFGLPNLLLASLERVNSRDSQLSSDWIEEDVKLIPDRYEELRETLRSKLSSIKSDRVEVTQITSVMRENAIFFQYKMRVRESTTEVSTWNQKEVVPAEFRSRVPSLASLLAKLSCATIGSPYVGRSILYYRAPTTEAEVSQYRQKVEMGRHAGDECPGAKMFTDGEWAFLERLGDDVVRPIFGP